jgi:hypothetical protein
LSQQDEDTGQAAERPASEAEEGDGGEQEAGAAQSGAAQDGEIAQEAAMRLLNSVEEGEPRVEVSPASRGGKDW